MSTIKLPVSDTGSDPKYHLVRATGFELAANLAREKKTEEKGRARLIGKGSPLEFPLQNRRSRDP